MAPCVAVWARTIIIGQSLPLTGSWFIVSNRILVRRLTTDADRYGVEALTYEGLESYLNTLVCIEATRRAGSRANPRAVAQSLANMGAFDVGDFVLDVGRPGRSASEWVRVGLRARSGHLLR